MERAAAQNADAPLAAREQVVARLRPAARFLRELLPGGARGLLGARGDLACLRVRPATQGLPREGCDPAVTRAQKVPAQLLQKSRERKPAVIRLLRQQQQPDEHRLQHKEGPDLAWGSAHCFEDADLPRALVHGHDHGVGYADGGHQ